MTNQSQLLELYKQDDLKKMRDSHTAREIIQAFDDLFSGKSNIRIKYRHTPEALHEIRDSLHEQFPNFEDVISNIFGQLQLTALSRTRGTHFKPILIAGPAGVGKTRMAQSLADRLKLGFVKVDMSTATSSFIISGNSTKWGNASPGVIASNLLSSKLANPIVFLDELDKAGGLHSMSSGNTYDTSSALLTLLESHSAKIFVDEYIGFPMDASNVNFIATANDISKINEFVLSRFHVVHVKMPEQAQLSKIAGYAYQEVLTELQLNDVFESTLEPAVIELLASHPSSNFRVLKRIVTDALFSAGQRNSNTVTCFDIESVIAKIDKTSRSNSEDTPYQNTKIGFLK